MHHGDSKHRKHNTSCLGICNAIRVWFQFVLVETSSNVEQGIDAAYLFNHADQFSTLTEDFQQLYNEGHVVVFVSYTLNLGSVKKINKTHTEKNVKYLMSKKKVQFWCISCGVWMYINQVISGCQSRQTFHRGKKWIENYNSSGGPVHQLITIIPVHKKLKRNNT